VVYKRLNSTGTLIQKTTMEAPQETLCITSDWMFTRRRSATARVRARRRPQHGGGLTAKDHRITRCADCQVPLVAD
jgi:hypothetical protein